MAAATPSLVEAALAATEDAADASQRLHRLLEAAAAGLPPARLQLELETAALRSPGVAAALDRRRESARQALGEALGAPAAALAELAASLCEGLARRRLLEPEADLRAQVEAAWRLLAAAL